MKNKYIVERTDGTTDHIEADIFHCTGGVVTFYEIIGSYEQTKIVRAYPYHSVVCVMPYEEDEKSQNEKPERRENTNNDLISRKDLINAKPEFMNEKVVRDTKYRTTKDRIYAKAWNACNRYWLNTIKNAPTVKARQVGHSCDTCKYNRKIITEEPCSSCNIRLGNDKWEPKDGEDEQ